MLDVNGALLLVFLVMILVGWLEGACAQSAEVYRGEALMVFAAYFQMVQQKIL